MNEPLFHAGVVLFLVIVLIIAYNCLPIDSKNDDISKEYWDEYWGKDE